MRCLTLADALTRQGHHCEFICRAHSGHLGGLIKSKGYAVHLLPIADHSEVAVQEFNMNPHAAWLGTTWQQDADQTLAVLMKQQRTDWLVVDHYALDLQWEQRVRPTIKRLMVIDDLADRNYECDLLVDVTLNRKKKEYQGRVPDETRLLLGPVYSLLRPQFIENRELALEKRMQFKGANRILVTMGGNDPLNATSFILQAISQIDEDVKVDVVLGKHAPHISEVKKLIQKSGNNIELHHDVRNMAELMLSADVAIGTPSTTALERCCLGLPSIVITTEINQYDTAKALHESGAVNSVGWLSELTPAALLDSLFALLTNKDDWFAMSRQAFSLCDGQGVSRTVRAMIYES